MDSNSVFKDADDAIDYLTRLVNRLRRPELQTVCNVVLSNGKFKTQWGGVSRHHDFPGGLAVHTAEVVLLARKMAVGDADTYEVATVAGIFHDFCKIFSYEPDPENPGKVRKADYERLIGHVAGSWAFFNQLALQYNVDEDLRLQIGHAMLAHHGRLEWRSPVEPQTKAAFILHSADMLSSGAYLRPNKEGK